MRAYAGDLEAGDRLTSGQVVQVATEYGGFRSEVLPQDSTVSSVLDEHPHTAERVMVHLMSGLRLDLHRSAVVRVVES